MRVRRVSRRRLHNQEKMGAFMTVRSWSFLAVAIAVCFESSYAEPPAEPGFLVTSAGCKFVNPLTKETGVRVEWAGECLNGFVDGSGEVVVTGSRTFTFRGDFKAGQLVAGMCESSRGSTYEGEFKNNLAHGKGVWKNKSGMTMTATFSEGEVLPDGVTM